MALRPRLSFSSSQEHVLAYAERVHTLGKLSWAELSDYVMEGAPHAKLLTTTLNRYTIEAWRTTLTTHDQDVVIGEQVFSAEAALTFVVSSLAPLNDPSLFLSTSGDYVSASVCVSCLQRNERATRSLFRPWKLALGVSWWYSLTENLQFDYGIRAAIAACCTRCWKPCGACGAYPSPIYSTADMQSRREGGLCQKCTPFSLLSVTPPKFTPNKLRGAARLFHERGL